MAYNDMYRNPPPKWNMPQNKHSPFLRDALGTCSTSIETTPTSIQATEPAIIAIMGRTGSGKSTLIAHLAIEDYSEAIGHRPESGD